MQTSFINQSCHICEAEIPLEENTFSGELIKCGECGSDYEVVIDNGKVNLTTAPEVQEDWGE